MYEALEHNISLKRSGLSYWKDRKHLFTFLATRSAAYQQSAEQSIRFL